LSRSLLPKVLALVAVAAIFGLAGYFSRSSSRAALPPAPAPAARPEVTRGAVQSINADSLILVTDAGPVTLKLPPKPTVEALRKTDLASVRPGDWVNGGAVPNAQTLFALTGIVVIPESDLGSPR
jgi:hypothetical protein